MECLPTKEGFSAQARSRIDIQSQVATGTDYGGQSLSWLSTGIVWAIMESASGREIYAQGQLQSIVTHKFTIRYQTSLSNTLSGAKNRIMIGSRQFNVKSVRNLDGWRKYEGKVYQELLAEETQIELE